MVAIAPLVRLGAERARATRLAGGAVVGASILTFVDPNQPGHYPTCPTKFLLGVDCPACGTLRGLHDLAHGHVVQALDHNVLLALAVPVAVAVWWGWVRTAAGRPGRSRTWSVPRWLAVTGVAALVAFTVVRNLDLPGLTWLDSA